MTTWLNAAKRDALIAAMGELPSVFVHAFTAGADLPPEWSKHPHIVLQLGYSLPVPMEAFKIGESGFEATLSFNRTPYPVVVPWQNVFGIVDPKAPSTRLVFDHPPPVAPLVSPPPPPPTGLAEFLGDPDAAPKPKRPSHLRIVK